MPRLNLPAHGRRSGLIGATLRAVHAQDYPGGFEMIHIDSGSTDNTVGVIRSFNPAKLIEIPAAEYVPGVVLNRGMCEARSFFSIPIANPRTRTGFGS